MTLGMGNGWWRYLVLPLCLGCGGRNEATSPGTPAPVTTPSTSGKPSTTAPAAPEDPRPPRPAKPVRAF